MKFYSHGKLLIAGEYLVLNGATSLTVPLTYGQSLEAIVKNDQRILTWESYEQEKLWFKGKFNTEFFDIIESTDQQIAQRLSGILQKTTILNPQFASILGTMHVATDAEFKFHWGFGSSSTLLSNIASWARVDPYKLHLKTSSGSGYDVVVARENGPVFFKKKKTAYEIEKVNFNPQFKDQIYFIYLGQKQDSAISVDQFKAGKKSFRHETKLISELSRHIAAAGTLIDFEYYMKEHELIISSVLKQKRIKEARFMDLEGEIKSLGAWGGDFAMMTWHDSRKKLTRYLEEKNIDTIFSFEELVKNW
jgi:mevalonate kinase